MSTRHYTSSPYDALAPAACVEKEVNQPNFGPNRQQRHAACPVYSIGKCDSILFQPYFSKISADTFRFRLAPALPPVLCCCCSLAACLASLSCCSWRGQYKKNINGLECCKVQIRGSEHVVTLGAYNDEATNVRERSSAGYIMGQEDKGPDSKQGGWLMMEK